MVLSENKKLKRKAKRTKSIPEFAQLEIEKLPGDAHLLSVVSSPF